MFRLTCKVAALNAGLDTTLFRSADFVEFVQGHFRSASGGDIELDVQFDPSIQPVLSAGEAAVDGDLHFAMRQLTQNPSRPPIVAMGLLVGFAHASDSQMFGLMFDRGIAQVPGDLNAAVAREGAAIFLDPITHSRSGADVSAECRFTSVHELGHAFNLAHAPQIPPTFMSRSALNATAYNAGAYFFEPEQADQLSRCSTDTSVQPGGSPFTDGDAGNTAATRRRQRPGSPPLKLTVEARPTECTRYEPIHLDIALSMTDRSKSHARVPRVVDPAHESFRIYIEDPDGHERRYHSSIHCCPTARKLEVRRSDPFRRDVVLITEQGRYTFRSPGVHRIRAEFDVAPGVTLHSNRTQIMILRDRDPSRGPTARVLRTLGATQLLQFRRAPNTRTLSQLHQLIDSWRGRWDERRCLLAYRWALAVLETRGQERSRERVAVAVRFLQKCRYLRAHRESRASALVEAASRSFSSRS